LRPVLRILPLALLLLASRRPGEAAEEVLHLKNGRQIVVDLYWEEGEQILYLKNGGTFGFPRDLLDRVDRLEPPPAVDEVKGPGSGFRNEVAVESIEAARKSAREGDIDEAAAQYRKALETEPESIATRLELGALYLARGDLAAAQSQLEQAKRISPEDARVCELLGDVYYRMGRTPLAIREWQAALSTAPSPGVLYKLKKALRENDEDVAFEERENARFVIRYEGSVNETIGRIVAAALEEEYRELASELRFAPRAPITATLYTNQEFFDVTLAPTWASGLNDGEIRIPVEGVTEMTSRLRRVLRHELTHSFVNALTAGNCPSWFHEGIAQLREGGERSDPYPRVEAARAEGSLLPLWSLEGPLLNYSKEKALLAYAEALAATEYLAARRGRPALIRILHLLGERQTMNDALKKVVGLDYQEFQTAWEADLGRYPTGH
jgi:tetratricopeptide (TPR) repeat protein